VRSVVLDLSFACYGMDPGYADGMPGEIYDVDMSVTIWVFFGCADVREEVEYDYEEGEED